MSVAHEVAAALRGRIAHGELRPGMRLPSERALAAQLSVSRVTVVHALTRLRLEGLVVTRHGSGTFVAATDRLVDTIAARSPHPGPAGADALDLRWATTAGPADLVQAVEAAVHAALPAALHSDGTSPSALTELLAHYLTRTGLPTRPDQLTLTSGAMTGLSLVLDVAAPPGGATVTETPTYPGALRILSQRNRRVRGWPAGHDGWDPGYLARLMRQGSPGVLYVQPDGHNPTGATMAPATRETLGRTAAAAGWLVVTDETMRPLHLPKVTAASKVTTASLAATNHHVIAVSSLSKTVWGGLHLGWIRAPAATTRHLRNAADATGAGPSALDQITTAHLLPELDAIIGRRARLLTENLRHLERRLSQIGHPGLRWHTPAAGVTLWLDLHPRSSHEVVRDCARRGVLLEPASTFAVDGHDDRHLRIPFTAPPATLDRVADALSQALER